MENWEARRHFTFHFILSELWLVESLEVFEPVGHMTTSISQCFVIAINHPERVGQTVHKSHALLLGM